MPKSLIILAALALIGAAVVRAEEPTPPPKPARSAGGPGGPHMRAAGLVPPRMAEQLALTDDQKAKLAELDKQFAKDRADWMAANKPALDQLHKEMEEARAAKDQAKIESLQVKGRELHKGLSELRKKYMDQFTATLTDEQKQKLDKAREERRGEGRGPGGARSPHGPKDAEK